MKEQPGFWRDEIWHPLSVHLPIALLLFATLFYLIGFISKKGFWSDMGKVLLLIGTLSAWVAVYTGDMADGIVSRKLCDPTILKQHENNAYMVGWLFTAASVLVMVDYWGVLRSWRTLLSLAIIICCFTGSGYLVYTGHQGASLVYQQAAGVYTPSEDCLEFNR